MSSSVKFQAQKSWDETVQKSLLGKIQNYSWMRMTSKPSVIQISSSWSRRLRINEGVWRDETATSKQRARSFIDCFDQWCPRLFISIGITMGAHNLRLWNPTDIDSQLFQHIFGISLCWNILWHNFMFLYETRPGFRWDIATIFLCQYS